MTEIWIDIIINILIIVLLLIGAFVTLSASIGIIRFPDIYTRLHAATKASTVGVASVLIGAFIYLYAKEGIVSGKLLIGILFILITAPVSAHMIGRAAHNSGIKPLTKNRTDAYEEAMQKQNKA
ncbi:monovalent cation/H(+) antiporter subunit G [Ornithinibacillus contaminans]|uniref:monovalent cation/H(+) antiporter subunit G n=1 Tax=Ornithinibacillus contaminans TaxID=694055 RepID=UPI00064D991B|nr:monovalent cation/H(+) antiporter subunit G [Ornithinibacillus contaminans]